MSLYNPGGIPGGGNMLPQTTTDPGMMPEGMPMARPRRVTRERIAHANEILKKYKGGKGRLETRLLEDEKWWRGHAWNCMQERANPKDPKRPTKWLVNVIIGKHADAMDAYPEPVILPREESDEQEAKVLTSVLPVILEQNHFKSVYRQQAWEKNKHGTGAYAVYWDKTKLNGLGDVNICGIDLVNLFWEPGIEDIQKSENLFFVTAQSKEQIRRNHPELDEKNLDSEFSLAEYTSEDNRQKDDKCLVIDWYYHTYENGRKTLQYCQYVGLEALYSSEDDPNIGEEGWYADGLYPFVLDVLFPQKNSPAGWGFVDLGKDTQETIDLLNHAITKNAQAGSVPRYFSRKDSGINLDEYLDFRRPIVEVEGALGDANIMPIPHYGLDGIYVTHYNNVITELKETCSNQDVSNGITSGVTAASGIAAQQEAAGRTSRDANAGSYEAYSKLLEMVIERIRQFYDVPRTFRIVGEQNAQEFVSFDNSGLVMQPNAPMAGMEMGWRKPLFDIKVGAQKENAYTQMARNELAIQLMNMGAFEPTRVDQTLLLLSMMDFNGKDELERKLRIYGDLQQKLAMMQSIALDLAQRYEPETAEQIAAAVMGEAAPEQQQTAGGGAMPTTPKGEPGTENAAHMIRAREQSRSTTQPQ